jgi:anaerobic magnesium-protoporphyrin IX monomethyl ester cyclase
MKILFVNPLFRNSILNTRFRKMDNIIPPLGILYIASLLKKYGIDSTFLDGLIHCNNISDFLEYIRRYNPDIVAFTSMSSNFDIAVCLAKEIKNFNSKIMTVLGGHHVTARPYCIKDNDFDIGVIGEGEFTFLDIIISSKEKAGFSHIKGIAYKDDGSVILNESRPPVLNLDTFPYPEREILGDIRRYHPAVFNYKHSPCITIMTSRGCNHKCIYCVNSLDKHTFWREHSANYVLGEIEEIIKTYNIRNFWILDDDFSFNKERVYEICEGLLRKDLKINWSCMMRADRADQSLLTMMKKAGCWQIAYGVESGSERILKFINKKTDLSQIREALNLTKKAKIEAKGFFMIGFPTETAEDIEHSIGLATHLPLNYATFFPVTVVPGSLLEKEVEKYGKIAICHSKIKMPYMRNIFIPDTLSETEIVKWQKKAYHRFYLRVGYIFGQLIRLRSLEDVKQKVLGLLSLIFQ